MRQSLPKHVQNFRFEFTVRTPEIVTISGHMLGTGGEAIRQAILKEFPHQVFLPRNILIQACIGCEKCLDKELYGTSG